MAHDRRRRIRASGALWAAALWGAAVASAVGARADEPAPARPSLEAVLEEAEGDPAVTRRMETELQRQQRMLRQLQRGEVVDESDLEAQEDPGPDAALREAPAAPVDRPLPLAIFEERRVRIDEGTWGNRRRLDLLERRLDADGDGRPELVRWVDPESGRMVRQQQDRNYDGVTDTWSDYQGGALVARTLDANDDGHADTWEQYREGRMIRRENDRDDDGVRDAFYRYEEGLLSEERHDTDNDGRIDLRVVYSGRRRVRAEEDVDRDGRMDTWRQYEVVDGRELVTRIERDKKGRGFADTFETFEAVDGKALLSRREEDLDGDGEVDVTSFYRAGRLVRREILRPDLAPL